MIDYYVTDYKAKLQPLSFRFLAVRCVDNLGSIDDP